MHSTVYTFFRIFISLRISKGCEYNIYIGLIYFLKKKLRIFFIILKRFRFLFTLKNISIDSALNCKLSISSCMRNNVRKYHISLKTAFMCGQN